MALTPSTTATGSLGYASPATLDPALIAEVREAVLSPMLANYVDMSGMPGSTYIWPIITTAPVVNSLTSGANEADVLSNVNAVVVGNPTATLAVRASGVILSDLSAATAQADLPAAMRSAIARALADKMDVDFLTLLNGFSNTAGTSGVDCSLDDLRSAMVTFKKTAKSAAEGGVFVLHPQQIGDVNAQLISGAGAALSSMLSRADLVDIFGATPGRGALSAYQGNLFGIPLFSSSNVQPTDTTNYNGALFVPKQALGMAVKWLARIEEASLGPVTFQAGRGIYGSSCYGVIEIDNAKGVSIITDY